MAAISQLVQELRDEARNRWYYLVIIFACVGSMAGVGVLLEVLP
jgi:hypothetical protein